ncbi:MAG TPA: CpsB/CapC family capsule biosynthesis tyrosine phosphatase [Solirubrobacteraceae bacterium]|nr:CpsB/CapC family capsule biosynthesis tyrosine phosphatase [Solirubrobacteraceae bacterium]
MAWVELHFHLLPGIDDGPPSIEDSLRLAAAAIEDGTGAVVTTPHVNGQCVSDPSEIPDRTRELGERFRRERIALQVLPGGELAHGMVQRLSDRQLAAIAQGPEGNRWVLLEAPFSGLDESYTAAADELRERGFAVVVAHPERARATSGSAAALQHELAAGSALQLNAWSFAGLNGEEARKAAFRLVHGPRVVLASDAHSTDRGPAIRLGMDALRRFGYREPHRLAGANPRALLEGGLAVREMRPIGDRSF